MAFPKSISISHSLSLVKPLAELFNMNAALPSSYSFSHTRIFKNNHAFVLSNRDDWFLSSYMQGKQSTIPDYDYFDINTKQFLWSTNRSFLKDRASLVAVASQHINIEAAFMVQVRTEDYSDRFVFADDVRKNDFLTTFINYPSLLDTVIQQYYQRSESLIAQANNYKFLVTHPVTHRAEADIKTFPTQAVNQFLSQTLNHPVDLSEKEYLYLTLSILGIKPKVIAERFHLSHRTIENSLQTARIKLQCTSTHEMFARLHTSGAFNLYLAEINPI